MCRALSLFLQVITNCVCAPDQSLTTAGGFWPQQLPGPSNRVLTRMWQVVQNNNGIKVQRGFCSKGFCWKGFRFFLSCVITCDSMC